MKLNPTQVGRAGEHYVTAEIHRRGGYAACFGDNMPKIDILASNMDQTRKISIQVKTKTRGAWQTSSLRGKRRRAEEDPDRFWVLVDLSSHHPGFFIVPEWWIENDIYHHHAAYLKRSGGTRPKSPDSKHHSIKTERVEQWRERWDLLGLFKE